MSLFSVTIHRKKIVTKYLDKRGKKFEQYEELITETYHDLPIATCLGYKKLDPNAVIVAQDDATPTKNDYRGKYTVRGESAAAVYSSKKSGFSKPVEKPEAPKRQGYADVVNTMMKDVA